MEIELFVITKLSHQVYKIILGWIIFCKMIRVSLIYILVCGILSATIHVVPSVSEEVTIEEEYCRRDYMDYCEEWAAEGECEDDHDYMWLKCPKSCKSCGPKECEGCDECDDRHPSCGLLAWLEECETNMDSDYFNFMSVNCKTSCKIGDCGAERLQTVCSGSCCDKSAGCAGWARQGQCKDNLSYMYKYCKATCELC